MDEELKKLLKLFDAPLPVHTEILRDSLKSYAQKARGISINKLAEIIDEHSERSINEASVRRFWNNKSKSYKSENLKCFAAFLFEEGYITFKSFDEHELSPISSPTRDLPKYYETNNNALVNPYVGLFANVKSSQLENEPVILFNFSQSEVEGELYVQQNQFENFEKFSEWEQQYPQWKNEAKKLFEAREQGYATLKKLENELPRAIVEECVSRLYGSASCPKYQQIEIKSKNANDNQIYLQVDVPTFLDSKNPTEVYSFHVLDNSQPILDLTNPNATLDRFIYFQRIDEFSAENIQKGYENYKRRMDARPELFRTRRGGPAKNQSDTFMYKGINTNPTYLGSTLISLAQALVTLGPVARPDIETVLLIIIKLDADIHIKTQPNQETLLHILASVQWPESKDFANSPLLDSLVLRKIDLLALDCEGLLASTVAMEAGNHHLANVLKQLEQQQASELGIQVPSQQNLND